jgi:hypothetical protein
MVLQMHSRLHHILYGALALLIVPLLFAGYVIWSYHTNLMREHMYSPPPGAPWLAVFCGCLALGSVVVAISVTRRRIFLVSSYLVLMALLFLVITLIVACNNGYCF